MEKKLSTTLDSLCKGFPEEFITYMTYCRNLRFDEKPDYAYLKTMFKELFIKSGFEMDYIFDWNIVDEERKKDKQEKEKQTQ